MILLVLGGNMGLLTKILIASAIKGAVAISENVAEVAVARSNERAAEANARAASARAAANTKTNSHPVSPNNTKGRINPYDIDLFYAKVAIISFIAKADGKIGREERSELDQMITVANNMYGYEVAARARGIIDNEGSSFIALEPYLRKIQDRDLDSFVFYADEIAKTDNRMTAEEDAALNKLRSYIDSRKGIKEFHDLICAGCGGQMRSDEYGYKAVCTCCGRETILNIENSPAKTNKPTACASCGRSLDKFDNSKSFSFCPYCGGNVYNNTGPAYIAQKPAAKATSGNRRKNNNEPNLFISYTTINPAIGLVTRIVSTGVKNTYTSGQTISFNLPQGRQEIILKIGLKNYSRTVVIPASNSPVRIYASYNGRAQISIDQPPC
ncbi:MAG: hypothetical protein IJ819_04060 [Clostridiales bacterium]|nr:hypothetical protein [Clostridiales bacterium]